MLFDYRTQDFVVEMQYNLSCSYSTWAQAGKKEGVDTWVGTWYFGIVTLKAPTSATNYLGIYRLHAQVEYIYIIIISN